MAKKKKSKAVWWYTIKTPEGYLSPYCASTLRSLAHWDALRRWGISDDEFKKRGYRVVQIEVREL